jgi:hypothetical protein
MHFKKLIYLLLLLSFSLAYMEWGGGNHSFVFEIQLKVFTNRADFISNFTHPVILVGLIGQVILGIAIFRSHLRFGWILTAIILLGIPILLILISALFSSNLKMILSTLPFLGLAIWTLTQNSH